MDQHASDSHDRQGGHAGGRLLCPQCTNGYLVERQCKRICEGCGYVESCEDSFVPTQTNPRESAPAMS